MTWNDVAVVIRGWATYRESERVYTFYRLIRTVTAGVKGLNQSNQQRMKVREGEEMNAREVYNAIETGNREDQRQALFELLTMVNALSFAVLELAGSMKLKEGSDPLGYRSRLLLSEFTESSK